jgi:hypothetical protein
MHESLSGRVDAQALPRAGVLLRRMAAAYRVPFEQGENGEQCALDLRTERLIRMAITLYAVGTIVAILFHRHLFGDAAWFLVKVLSENQVTDWYSDFSSEFFRSRWFAFHFSQWPVLWASRLDITSVAVLSWIFGVSLFLGRALSLLVCWLWLRDKRLFLFPLASLFAGSINAEVYIVSETHFLLSLVWPLLVLLSCADLTPARRRVWLVLVAIPTLLAYEAMAFFGPLLIVAAGLRARAHWKRLSDRILFLALAAYFALGSIFAVLAIVWPRDTLNRGTFVSGIPAALELGHLGIAASMWLTLTFPLVVYLWPRHRKVGATLLAAPVLLEAVYVGRMFLQPEQVDFETHVYARGMGVLVPFLLCLMFLVQPIVVMSRRRALIPCLRAVAVLGLFQCVWSIGATVFWANMVTALRFELARTAGVVPYQSTVLAKQTLRGMPMKQLHLVWPLLPMSIVLGGSPEVSSVIFAESHPFAPFNPRAPDELPNLSRFGVHYDGLKATLADNGHLDFRPGGNGKAFLGEGWEPDAWAHWTDGTRATIRLPKHCGIERGGELQMRLGAFVPRQHPRQRVILSLNGRRLGSLELSEAQMAGGPTTIHLAVPPEMASCGDELLLQLDLPDAQSPKSLGLSNDVRRLGIALVELRLVPTQTSGGYEGYLEEMSCDRLRGWAWDSSQPDRPVSIDLYDGDSLLKTTVADQFRQDLLDGQKGNGRHLFIEAFPPAIKDGTPHSIRAVIKGTSFTLRPLAETPSSVKCAR